MSANANKPLSERPDVPEFSMYDLPKLEPEFTAWLSAYDPDWELAFSGHIFDMLAAWKAGKDTLTVARSANGFK